MKMKAAIYYGPHDIRIQKIERPQAEDGIDGHGILIRVEASGICNIKDTAWWQKACPDYVGTEIVLGHENSGEVVEVGSRITSLKVGDRVAGYAFQPCLKCEQCKAGNYSNCMRPTEGSSGTWINGSMAEYLLIPYVGNNKPWKLPDDVSCLDAALFEPTILGIGLANKAVPGDVVVILGQELMGLAALAWLEKKGIEKVIVSDVSTKRLQAAGELGAKVVINELEQDVVKVVMAETAGRGADVVIETSRRPINFQQAISVVQPMGSVWLTSEPYYAHYALHPNLEQVPGSPHRSPQKQAADTRQGFSIKNAWGTLGDGDVRREQSIKLMQEGIISASKHVTHVFPLEKVPEAFETALNPHESIKVMFKP
ncbi:MAG: alcohol dehydrogenase catalytic domain-containing protein [Dehalococcoidales bacterium]|nr:alcohol dehydrogenase catalytic domain-containing protein [Dehalococcoidales bacterium]